MNTNELEIAEKAFKEAISCNYPADIIKILYEDLKKARKHAVRNKKIR